ncbi:MAG: hypothetical protein H7A47_07915 [Verrucomicrobiales bacterium]|nr:hypothetical protein [Verrucomicrobiales bacterium]
MKIIAALLFGLLAGLAPVGLAAADPSPLRLAGCRVAPHVRAEAMRYRRPRPDTDGALVRLFLLAERDVHLGEVRWNGRTATERLNDGTWYWHDFPDHWSPDERRIPAGTGFALTFNAVEWPADSTTELTFDIDGETAPLRLSVPCVEAPARLEALTFPGREDEVHPIRMIFHVTNGSDHPMRLVSCRLHLPDDGRTWRHLRPGPGIALRGNPGNARPFPVNGIIPPHDQGGAVVETGPLPLAHAVVEVTLEDHEGHRFSLWAHQRIKREWFDISGGWVSSKLGGGSTLAFEPYLKTLKRLHVNTGHIADTPGFTDHPDLYTRYPLKYFNKLQPLDHYDRDALLPRIHAVEFLGEPQYGGGRPVPPMEVFQQLLPYATSRLTTTVTHSEERIWAAYMGLCDYPHYDAYRVTAPSPDSWGSYERWGEQRIRWGAPLETIGDMCRSLREMSRPAPTAIWSQGAHAGWDRYGGRLRTSPTPDELRLQAYHALATRITSLYWFNLSLKSLVKFRDLLDEITRVGREIRLLDEFYVSGAPFEYRRISENGHLAWDLSSVVSPRAALLFALDLDYAPDPVEKVFRFGPARPARFEFRLPAYLRGVVDVFRIDADGAHEVSHTIDGARITLEDRIHKVAVYVATPEAGLRLELERKRRDLLAGERAWGFDPAGNDADFSILAAAAGSDR